MTDERVKKAIDTANALFGGPVDAGVDNSDGLLKDSFVHIYGEVWSRPALLATGPPGRIWSSRSNVPL